MAFLLFFDVISENEWSFDLLYCVAFMVMDKQWLERNATYMEFNVRRILRLYICQEFYYHHVVLVQALCLRLRHLLLLSDQFKRVLNQSDSSVYVCVCYITGCFEIHSSSVGEGTSNG